MIDKEFGNTTEPDAARLVNAIESVPDGFVYYDRDDRLVLCNQRYREMYALTGDAIRPGITFTEILRQGLASGQYPEAEGREEEWLSERLAMHQACGAPVEQQLPDGKWLRIEERRMEDGGIVGFRVDITEQKERERALAESEARLRATISSALDAVIVIDAQGLFLDINPTGEDMFGYAREDLLGHAMVDYIVPHAYREGHNAGMAHFNRTGEGPVLGKRIELTALRKSGQEFPIELAINEVRQNSGTIFVAYVRDITEQKRAAEQMQEAQRRAEDANRSKSEFLANMSHEIRTPLNAMLGLAGILQESGLTAKQIDHLNTLQHSGKSLLYLINDILDFSRLEAGEVALEESDFSLRYLIEESVELFHQQAREKGLSLVYETLPGFIDTLHGDVERIRQVLHNFLSNALKFTTQGSVTIRAQTRMEQNNQLQLTLEVEDTGNGIHEDELPRLFDRFTQLDQSATKSFKGVGLGLAISKGLAELLGGTTSARSTLGQGSVFSLELPINMAMSPTADDPLASLSGITVALDIENTAQDAAARALFRDAGATIVEAGAPGLSERLKAQKGPAILFTEPDREKRALIQRLGPFENLEGQFRIAGLVHADWTAPLPGFCDLRFEAPMRYRTTVARIRESLGLPFEFQESSKTLGPEDDGTNSKGLRILVVDDNHTNQLVCTMMLEGLGHSPDAVSSGPDALVALTHLNYDVVLMDVQMPGMDGLEATSLIRNSEDETLSKIPILAVTANVFPETQARCYAAGMNGFVGKPVSRQDLRDALAPYLPSQSNATQTSRPKSEIPLSSQEEQKKNQKDQTDSTNPSLFEQGKLDELVATFGPERFQSVFEIFVQELRDLQDRATAHGMSLEDRARLAHRLKGIAGDFGARDLRQAAATVEDRAQAGDNDAAIEAYRPMLDSLAKTLNAALDL